MLSIRRYLGLKPAVYSQNLVQPTRIELVSSVFQTAVITISTKAAYLVGHVGNDPTELLSADFTGRTVSLTV